MTAYAFFVDLYCDIRFCADVQIIAPFSSWTITIPRKIVAQSAIATTTTVSKGWRPVQSFASAFAASPSAAHSYTTTA
jgi:hypothetical protein